MTSMNDLPPAVTGVGRSAPHAVVIGSGFGGLAAAVRLGARGYRVTVLERLDAPVRRVGAKDVFCGYAPQLEDATLPQSADIEQALRELLAY